MIIGPAPAWPGGRQAGKWQEESSFCEQATAKKPRRKEAKKLYPLAAGSPDSRLQVKKVFCFFFSKKKILLSCRLPCLPGGHPA
jgi:hypothetical protein